LNTDLATLSDSDATAGADTITVNASDSFGNAAVAKTVAVTVLSGPTGIAFTPDTNPTDLSNLISSSSTLLAGGTIGAFTATGDGSGAVFTYSLSGANAASFSLSGSTGVLTIGGSNITTSGLYKLAVKATDQVANFFTQNFDLYLGTGGNTVNNLGTTEGSTTTPTLVYALGGTDTINASTISANLWVVGYSPSSGKDTGNVVTLGSGTDTVSFTGSNISNTVTLGSGTDTVTFTGSGNSNTVKAVIGSTLNTADSLTGAGSDTLAISGNGGSFNLNNLAAFAGFANITLSGNTDTLTLTNSNFSTTITGTGDTVTLGSGTDTVTGGSGNTVTLGGGTDTVSFTSGTNTVNGVIGTGATLLTTDGLTGGSGTDTLVISGNSASFNLGSLASFTGFEDVTLSGSSDTLTLTNSNLSTTITGTGDTVILGGGTDTVTGGSGNTVTLGGGTDTVTFTSGTNTVNGTIGTGATLLTTDKLTGGSGTDTLVISGSNATFNLGSMAKFTGFEDITLSGSSDTLTLNAGSYTLTVGSGSDVLNFAKGDDPVTIGGSGTSGTISGYDTITDYTVAATVAASEKLGFTSVAVAANAGTTTGVQPSTLELHTGAVVTRDQISNGVISFDTNTSGTFSPVTLTSLSDVAAVVQYLENNRGQSGVDGTANQAVAFTATISGITNTFVYVRGSTNANDVLIDLPHVSATSVSTSGLTNQFVVLGSTAPAGIAGQPINLALTNLPSANGSPVSVTVSGMPSGWTLNEGENLGNGTWVVETNDLGALTVSTPAAYAGATVLNVTESWANSDGSVSSAAIADNIEAYAPNSPIIAIAGDDTLTGAGANDLFVFAQPIGNDVVHNFNAASDKIDLVGFDHVASFSDLQIADDSSGNAVITVGTGETITLHGVDAASLTASNFVFDQTPVLENSGMITISDGAVMPLSGTVVNIGIIELNSSGDPTELQIVGDGVTLEGGGQVILSDSSGDAIIGMNPNAILTNVDNTISGVGEIGTGNGNLTLINEASGTIDANDAGGILTLDTGHTITNYGVLEASNGGMLEVVDAVTGGAAVIAGGTLQLDAASNVAVTFDNGAGGTAYGILTLGDPSQFAGDISGFAGTGPDAAHSDAIDLVGINVHSDHFSDTYDSSTGVLTVTDGVNTDSLKFAGFTGNADSFDFTADASGTGTLITDSPPTGDSASDTHDTSFTADQFNNLVADAQQSTVGISPTASVTVGGPGGDHFVFAVETLSDTLTARALTDHSNNLGVDAQQPTAEISQTAPVTIGGPGGDHFVFAPGFGAETATNFNAQQDTIELDHFSNVQTVQELQSLITTDAHGDALINLGHNDSITFADTTPTQLQQAIQTGHVLLH